MNKNITIKDVLNYLDGRGIVIEDDNLVKRSLQDMNLNLNNQVEKTKMQTGKKALYCFEFNNDGQKEVDYFVHDAQISTSYLYEYASFWITSNYNLDLEVLAVYKIDYIDGYEIKPVSTT